MASKGVFSKQRTFRPKKKWEKGTLKYDLHKKAKISQAMNGNETWCTKPTTEKAVENSYILRVNHVMVPVQCCQLPIVQSGEIPSGLQATLSSGLDLRFAVALPDDEEYNDWVAVHLVDFFNRINIIYGTVCEFCTGKTCPVMSGGPKFEYYWADEKHKKPQAVSAPQYISNLMAWIEKQINDEEIFPAQVGVPFPKMFAAVAKKILTRLYRVFVHVYIHHFDKLVAIGAEAHVNSCYKHFYYFVCEFSLVDPKEFEPLRELTVRICR